MNPNKAAPEQSADKLLLDPLVMGITNRISRGTSQKGSLETEGGLVVEGRLEGECVVRDGPLVVLPGAKLRGRIEVHGDMYVLGQIEQMGTYEATRVTVTGTVIFAAGCIVRADVDAGLVRQYQGALVVGQVRELKGVREAMSGARAQA